MHSNSTSQRQPRVLCYQHKTRWQNCY